MSGAVRKAIILLAHGSRDPLWHGPVEAVAERVRALRPGVPVCCAYLELEQPDLGMAVQQCARQGIAELTIVPMFLGTGKHARDDLPLMVAALRQQHPDLAIHLRQPVGEDPRILDLLANVASE